MLKINSGEIPSIHHVKGQRGDGVGLTIDANKYEIAYMEGSRPAKVKNSKESDDRLKIAFNLRKMFFDIVNDRVEKRKIIVPEMKVFGGASFKLDIHLYLLDFVGR